MRRVVLGLSAGFLVFLLGAGPASAQYVDVVPPDVGQRDVGVEVGPSGGIQTSVLGVQFRNNPALAGVTAPSGGNVAAVAPQVRVQSARVSGLVVTGADVATLSLMALAFVIAGAALVHRTRRSEG